MPRDIPVGNGEMLVTFDPLYRIRDIYYPRTGMPSHTSGHVQRFGVWADGTLAWVEDDGWERSLRYKPDTLVTEVVLRHQGMGLELTCHDAVDYWSPVYFRKVVVKDLLGRRRDVRVFFHHDFSINDSPVGDTVNYDPGTRGLVHYKDAIYFLVNGSDEQHAGIDQWTTGVKRIHDAAGTWVDADDGELSQNSIAQGSVDSTVGFTMRLRARGSCQLVYWIAAGSSHQAVAELNRKVVEKSASRMMSRTEAYWRLWALKEPTDFSPLPEPIRDLYVRSQLIVRTHIDAGGAIIAASDSDITHFAGDHYCYVWPRDGALVSYALTLAGQGELSRRFFEFCSRVIDEKGFFLHKYNPSGTLASSWHPWTLNGQTVLPIQQDETALVLWALRQYFLTFRDVEFLKAVYTPLVIRPARWLLEHCDYNGLPRPSWDLWEERWGVHTFTTATTIAALEAGADFAREMGALDHAAEFREGAERMRGAMMRHLWSERHQRFARMATPTKEGGYKLDMTVDAANSAVFGFGSLPPDHPAVLSEVRAIRERLWVKSEIGGVARYENDYYHQVERQHVERVPGNPWVICTLWLAQHAVMGAKSLADLGEALPYLEWVKDRGWASGVLAEQFDPYSGAPLSVSPLVWSHATLITVVMQYLSKHAELTSQTAGAAAAVR